MSSVDSRDHEVTCAEGLPLGLYIAVAIWYWHAFRNGYAVTIRYGGRIGQQSDAMRSDFARIWKDSWSYTLTSV
jgi:hypothetical protein